MFPHGIYYRGSLEGGGGGGRVKVKGGAESDPEVPGGGCGAGAGRGHFDSRANGRLAEQHGGQQGEHDGIQPVQCPGGGLW